MRLSQLGLPASHAELASTPPVDRSGPLESIDESLHYGRAWHRYRYCYRKAESLRILDAGCGTGQSTLGAARLNPEAIIRGVDVSAAWVGHARERAEAAGLDRLSFSVHDLTEPLPTSWGAFDFILCGRVLGNTTDPQRVLSNLGRSLDPGGLLYMTFPSRSGRECAHALRRAVEALAPSGASLEERFQIGLDLFLSLYPDHPIRAQAGSATDPSRLVEDALTDRHDWTLDEASDLLERAGLKFLYAATPGRWLPERVFSSYATPTPLLTNLDRLSPDRLIRLVDALDPTLLNQEYRVFACLKGYSPVVPTWPQTRQHNPDSFDVLIPHRTGLADAARSLPSAASGRVIYQMVSGACCELDRLTSLMLEAVDGLRTCGAIDVKLSSRTRASDHIRIRQECWVYLADSGLVLLEAP